MIMMGETTTTSAATNSINNISSSSSPPTMPPPKQNHAAVLRCPRCDSTNTKFCYYNNYSLSQPRHFCKACKRYWTRGGTLRNVPVGGGCRKNKRVKKSSASAAIASAAATASTDPARSSSLISSLASANLDNFNSFLFGLPSSSSSVNHATNFASYGMQNCTRVDGDSDNNQFQLGFGASMQQSDGFLNGCPSLLPYQNLQASHSASFGMPREVKVERESNVIDPWQLPNSMMNPFEDSSYMYWNSAAMGNPAWPDVANSSIAPLI